ncbi:MAG: ubiquinone biosynthesis protein UbiA [Flavobacteriaceae bacterium]|nr:ubiquinone biosynthesis protein UbiA [Flavobacteriaceae bacterium]|tara:strand:- start:1199 stop:2080 length:882 start_codon:yes stop_codon:yes gene_type:complete
MSPIYKQKSILFKFLSIFSLVRIYNILIIVLAQYLTSIFILSDKKLFDVIFDFNLFLLIICSSLSIASGYIINNFYDQKKDVINKPIKSKIDDVVKNSTKLYFYFFLNFVVIFFASIISLRAIIFFSVYIFFLWFYSHKLKRLLFLGNLFYSLLTITPFFAILLYYKNIDLIIAVYALFLFFILLLKDITKDLKNLVGDFTENYQTIPVAFGEDFARIIISLITFINVILIINLFINFSNGYMNIYYVFSLMLLLIFTVKLYKSKKVSDYLELHNILRLIIGLGVFSIILLEI